MKFALVELEIVGRCFNLFLHSSGLYKQKHWWFRRGLMIMSTESFSQSCRFSDILHNMCFCQATTNLSLSFSPLPLEVVMKFLNPGPAFL